MAEEKSTCCVDGCGKFVRSRHAKYCEAHYHRLRRNGSLELKCTVKPGLGEHTGGYLLEYLPGHPLQRSSSSRVYQHRAVFYRHHGSGPFSCHWCGIGVTWETMHVDHLNDNPKDNTPSNLVASCPPCNQQRGAHKVRRTMKERGRLVTAHGKTMCISDWARHLGLSRATLTARLDKGLLPEAALTPDRDKFGPARTRSPIESYVPDCMTKQVQLERTRVRRVEGRR